MAGPFVRLVYSADYATGTTHPIRVQPETAAASIGGTANAGATGNASNPISVQASRHRKAKGLRPRVVTLRAPATAPPSGYQANGITRIPALNDAFYAAAVTGATCTYLGASFIVVSRSPELVG